MPKTIKTKTFCVKPWTQGCIQTDRSITLCCASEDTRDFNLDKIKLQDWWSSDFIKRVRGQMLAGEKINECNWCYTCESNGAESLRQRTNKEYRIFEQYADKMLEYYNYPTDTPVELEVHLTNLCNLKCLMCNATASSTISTENKILNIGDIVPLLTVTDHQITELQEWLLTKPKLLNLRGGEPLMVPEIKSLLQWAIEQDVAQDIELHISTNGTLYSQNWHEILQKFKKVRIMLSIESTGMVNDYIRFGSHWAELERNARLLSLLPNVNFVVNSTVSNLSLLNLNKLIDWCDKNHYWFNYAMLQGPDKFRHVNLPQQLREQAINNLLQCNNTAAKEIIKIVNAIPSDMTLWEEFKKEISIRDAHRGVSILNVIPELEPYWNA